ncbi:AhpC/TSA family protein [Mucilaginibacter limnophilus]|uniref:thioredoxin-dependent peroxiredoxin n=1 Tax=Mucilaginibacter limnophilus TaxID=1932778 RepID=A0A3S2Y1N1_9SPHI|nr:peroxiredoxin-like family protein [Mucilaginibacter limnophilus]RVT98488.1 AhpC/TSA family protein [Mucilaginibacter limnophilus]
MQLKNSLNTSWRLSVMASAFATFSLFCLKAVAGNSGFQAQQITRSMITADTIKMTAGVPLKAEDVSPLLAGERIPLLKLPGASGEIFDLNRSVAEKPTILVFYRGGWCPYCSKQLAGLQEIEGDLTKLGYQIIAISTDSPDNLSKSRSKGKLSYTLLSDADLNAAKRFGIAFKSPKSYDKFLPETSGGKNVDKLLPVPSVFILSKKGYILFEYINPNITQRLSAPLLKAAAAALREEV